MRRAKMNLISKPRIQMLIRQISLSSFRICWVVLLCSLSVSARLQAGHPVGLADMPNMWNLSAGFCDPLCLHLKTATFENRFSWTHPLIIQHSQLLRPKKYFPLKELNACNAIQCLRLFKVHRPARNPPSLTTPPASTHDSGWYWTVSQGIFWSKACDYF